MRTISDAVDPLRDAGLETDALPQAIETREIGDWRARTPLGAQKLTFGAFLDRAAVAETMARRIGAERVAAGFAAAGGAPRAADVVEGLLAPAATAPGTKTGPSGAGRS
ncbi:hypothetical protein LRS13_23755 [Svornostia abyssi]|uniref:Uncharacterized protein n=1 Tax=Svornostia abyssi TaxID=2898438 RepID=A0ABY5PG65_9ACTN|nr:hypothetical protein LRS13_23755 [Parviterribacteraceae bacterium J379]